MSNFKKLDYQVDLAKDIVKSLQDYDVAICAIPCGYGKTGIAYWLHRLFGERSLILNHNRILVDQYDDLYHDLDDIGCIKGKGNYPCPLDPRIPAVDCAPCQFKGFKCFHKANGSCLYYNLRKRFDSSSLGITNYQLVLSLLDIDSYSRKDNSLLICDECHNLDSILCDYRTVKINEFTMNSIENLVESIQSLREKQSYQTAKELQDLCVQFYFSITENNYKKKFNEFFNALKELELIGVRIVNSYADDEGILKSKHKRHIFRLSENVNNLHRMNCKYSNYLSDLSNRIQYVFQSQYSDDNRSYTLTPIYTGDFFTQVLYRISRKAILMSGTVVNLKNLKHTIGLDTMKVVYFDIPSLYAKENRPVLFCNTVGLNKSNSVPGTPEFNRLLTGIKDIVEYHAAKDESGVIFVPSYNLGNTIRTSLESFFNKLGITVFANTSSVNSDEILKKFSDTSLKRRLLISPSFEEGVNFSDDISRYQIIAKTPYLYLGDKRIKAKMDADKDWYETATMTRIIQSSARSVRNKKDYATTYVLDTNSSRLYSKMKDYCPKWFNEAVVQM